MSPGLYQIELGNFLTSNKSRFVSIERLFEFCWKSINIWADLILSKFFIMIFLFKIVFAASLGFWYFIGKNHFKYSTENWILSKSLVKNLHKVRISYVNAYHRWYWLIDSRVFHFFHSVLRIENLIQILFKREENVLIWSETKNKEFVFKWINKNQTHNRFL